MGVVALTKKDDYLSRLVEDYIRNAFDQRTINDKQSEKLWQYYYSHLSEALDIGYSPQIEQYDPLLAHSLKYNIAEFSAFKETSFKKQVEAALTKNGKVLSWSEFKAEADKLNIDYNRRWLQTEYHQTIANAQSAEKFKEYLNEKEVYPNLKYKIINDERTRDKHRAWDGLILPVEHPFWQKHLPPNDWGCRCYVEQTDEPATPLSLGEGQGVRNEFANNPAVSGKIFSKNPYEKGLSEIEIAQVKDKVKERLERHKKTGEITIHEKAHTSDLDRNKYVAEICAKDTGFDFHIREHIEKGGASNPEYLINNEYLGDRKSIERNKGIITQIDAAKTQMMNKFVNPEQKPYYIVWDLDAVEDLDWSKITHNLSKKITTERGTTIKGMFFQYKGKAVYISREDIVNRNYKALDVLK